MATKKAPPSVGMTVAAKELGISVAQMRVAIDENMVKTSGGGKVFISSLDAIKKDLPTFLKDLDNATPLNLTQAAHLLGVGTTRTKKAIATLGIKPCKVSSWQYGEILMWRKDLILAKVAPHLAADVKGNLATERAKKAAGTRRDNLYPSTTEWRRPVTESYGREADRAAREDTRRTLRIDPEEIEKATQGQNMHIRVLTGKPGPKLLSIHAGPTNSGKTYEALGALAAEGRGVYAGPLRMLAREAYDKLRAQLGDDKVGMVTGEEQINPEADIICATTEAAPLHHGGILVLDECHWLSDPQRGWAWTRMLVASSYQKIYAICDHAAVGTIKGLVPDAAEVAVKHHPRLSTLSYQGQVKVWDMPKGSAVVAFSRVAVLTLARVLKEHGRKPAVLYGALPPAARAAQVEKLIAGEADIMVTTDVIGHGINLPLTAVALAQTEKNDGVQLRRLHLWEAAQILGRAGRYGLNENGKTYTVTGLEWFSSDKSLTIIGTAAAGGKQSTNWRMPGKAQLRPTLGELGVKNIDDLPPALMAFTETTRKASEVLPVAPYSSEEIMLRVAAMAARVKSKDTEGELDLETAWNLATSPVDSFTLAVDAAVAKAGGTGAEGRIQKAVKRARGGGGSLEEAEVGAKLARELRAVALAADGLPGLSIQEAGELEDEAGKTVTALLKASSKFGLHGKCENCGKECAPWFSRCDRCHHGYW